MKEKIENTTDYLMIVPDMVIEFIVALFVIIIGAPYWAWLVCKGE